MLNTKLLKGALAAAAALVIVSPALAGPAVPMKLDQSQVELVHAKRYYKHNHHKPSPYLAWKYKKKHHNHFGWRKPYRYWGLGHNRHQHNRYWR
jgi:hypothetical protein